MSDTQHTVRYTVGIVVDTWGRMNAEFYLMIEEAVSVVTTMLKKNSRTPQDGGCSIHKARQECGHP